jgi:hypothetical protein
MIRIAEPADAALVAEPLDEVVPQRVGIVDGEATAQGLRARLLQEGQGRLEIAAQLGADRQGRDPERPGLELLTGPIGGDVGDAGQRADRQQEEAHQQRQQGEAER